MKLLQIRTGSIQEYRSSRTAWTSAIRKMPFGGSVTVSVLGIEGDDQADKVNHGGADKAILCYAREHYERWSQELGSSAPLEGTLGENFELGGATEEVVCIGDIFQIAGAVMQISQPREPCWKPAQLHGLPHLTSHILKTGRTGWYLRVLQGGTVRAPADTNLLERPHPLWTVARATRVMHFEKDASLRADLAHLEGLSPAWKDALSRK